VLLVPAHTAPYKADGQGGEREGGRAPNPKQRLEMCRLAAADAPGVSVCALEIDRGGVSYTVDTLRALHASHAETELTLIVGADVAGTLHSWREPAQLLALARLAVAARPGTPEPPLPDGVRASMLEMPAIAVSSSMVRERAARGEPIEEFVGAAVAGYIAEHHLYRVATRTGA
jgi:nicotinate-nucleotide adenylyltransferase